MYINFATINYQQQFDVPISAAAQYEARTRIRHWNTGIIGSNLTQGMNVRYVYRVSQEESSIFWEVTMPVILNKKVYMYMCSIPRLSYFTVQ
jgi:hypothetical protein